MKKLFKDIEENNEDNFRVSLTKLNEQTLKKKYKNETLFHAAIKKTNFLRYLFEHAAKLNLKEIEIILLENGDQKTVLECGIESGNQAALQFLLFETGLRSLLLSEKAAENKRMAEIFKKKPKVLDQKDLFGNTLLHRAIENIEKQLLYSEAEGAREKIKSLESVVTLLQWGASFGIVGSGERTAIEKWIYSDLKSTMRIVEAIAYLDPNISKREIFQTTCILESHSKKEAKESFEVDLCIKEKRLLEILLAANISVDTKGLNGKSLLDFLIEQQEFSSEKEARIRLEILKPTERICADMPSDEAGNTLLHWAIRDNMEEKIPALIALNYPVFAKNKKNETVLFLAKKKPRLYSMLLAAGSRQLAEFFFEKEYNLLQELEREELLLIAEREVLEEQILQIEKLEERTNVENLNATHRDEIEKRIQKIIDAEKEKLNEKSFCIEQQESFQTGKRLGWGVNGSEHRKNILKKRREDIVRRTNNISIFFDQPSVTSLFQKKALIEKDRERVEQELKQKKQLVSQAQFEVNKKEERLNILCEVFLRFSAFDKDGSVLGSLVGEKNIFQCLLKLGGMPVGVLDEHRNTLLHWAAERYLTEVVESLTANNVINLTHVNQYGQTVFHMASKYLSPSEVLDNAFIQLLAQTRKNSMLKEHEKIMPALPKNNTELPPFDEDEIVCLIEQNLTSETAKVVVEKLDRTIQMLTQEEMKKIPTVKNKLLALVFTYHGINQTLLNAARLSGEAELVRGIEIRERTKGELLKEAARYHELLTNYLNRFLMLPPTDKLGNTVLHHLFYRILKDGKNSPLQKSIFRWLEYSDETFISNRIGETPYDIAAEQKNTELLYLLFRYMQSQNAIVVVKQNDLRGLEKILEKTDAAFLEETKNARSLLPIALSKQQMRIAELLLCKGANLCAAITDPHSPYHGWTAFRFAAEFSKENEKLLMLIRKERVRRICELAEIGASDCQQEIVTLMNAGTPIGKVVEKEVQNAFSTLKFDEIPLEKSQFFRIFEGLKEASFISMAKFEYTTVLEKFHMRAVANVLMANQSLKMLNLYHNFSTQKEVDFLIEWLQDEKGVPPQTCGVFIEHNTARYETFLSGKLPEDYGSSEEIEKMTGKFKKPLIDIQKLPKLQRKKSKRISCEMFSDFEQVFLCARRLVGKFMARYGHGRKYANMTPYQERRSFFAEISELLTSFLGDYYKIFSQLGVDPVQALKNPECYKSYLMLIKEEQNKIFSKKSLLQLAVLHCLSIKYELLITQPKYASLIKTNNQDFVFVDQLYRLFRQTEIWWCEKFEEKLEFSFSNNDPMKALKKIWPDAKLTMDLFFLFSKKVFSKLCSHRAYIADSKLLKPLSDNHLKISDVSRETVAILKSVGDFFKHKNGVGKKFISNAEIVQSAILGFDAFFRFDLTFSVVVKAIFHCFRLQIALLGQCISVEDDQLKETLLEMNQANVNEPLISEKKIHQITDGKKQDVYEARFEQLANAVALQFVKLFVAFAGKMDQATVTTSFPMVAEAWIPLVLEWLRGENWFPHEIVRLPTGIIDVACLFTDSAMTVNTGIDTLVPIEYAHGEGEEKTTTDFFIYGNNFCVDGELLKCLQSLPLAEKENALLSPGTFLKKFKENTGFTISHRTAIEKIFSKEVARLSPVELNIKKYHQSETEWMLTEAQKTYQIERLGMLGEIKKLSEEKETLLTEIKRWKEKSESFNKELKNMTELVSDLQERYDRAKKMLEGVSETNGELNEKLNGISSARERAGSKSDKKKEREKEKEKKEKDGKPSLFNLRKSNSSNLAHQEIVSNNNNNNNVSNGSGVNPGSKPSVSRSISPPK